MFCGCPTDVRRRAQQPGLPGLPGPARLAAGGQPDGDRVHDPDRPGPELLDRVLVPVRAEELLLPGHAEGLPDLAVRRAAVHGRLAGRHRRRDRPVRVGIERVHLEEDTGKSLHVGGATGRIHGADYSLVDYNRAGIPLVEIVTKPIPGPARWRPEVARAYVTELRDLLRSLGVSDVRMEEGSLRCDVNTSHRAASASGAVGDPDRDQERQLAALGGARGPVRDRAAGRRARRRRPGHPGDQALPRGHRHDHRRAQSKEEAQDYRYFPEPDLVPVAPPRRVGGADPGRAARAARRPPGPAAGRVGPVRPGDDRAAERRRAGPGRRDRRGRRVAGRRAQVVARRARPPGQRAGHRADRRCRLPRPRWPGSPSWSPSGTLNDKLARAGDRRACWPGRVIPDEVVAARGLAVVSDDGALTAAVDEAIAANPDVAAKIRDGKVAAAGRPGRRGHEGHPRPGRRRPRPRADPGSASAKRAIHDRVVQLLGASERPGTAAKRAGRRLTQAEPNGARRRGRATAGAVAGGPVRPESLGRTSRAGGLVVG